MGANCYHFGSDAGREYDWKIASSQCKKLRGFLAEPEGTINMKELSAYILNKPNFLGKCVIGNTLCKLSNYKRQRS